MKGRTYLLLFFLIVLISLIGGGLIFNKPSWSGVFFYFLMFAALIGLAGHWIYHIK